MGPGTQLIAPDGMGPLEKGVTYYLMASRHKNGTALLATFICSGEEPRVNFIQLPVTQFERGLLDHLIVVAEVQSTLPPWLVGYEGVDIEEMDAARPKKKKTNMARADERYEVISPLVKRFELIVSSVDPYLTIRRLVAEHAPKQKAARIAPWFTAYVLFARSAKALVPAFWRIGTWDRMTPEHAGTKFGRPNVKKGRLSGYSAIPLAERIISGYLRFAGEGIPMTQIYRSAMDKVFGCKERRNDENRYEFYHPKGEPFPRLGQFRHRVKAEFGLQEVMRKKLGDVQFRNQVAVSKGPFSEAVSNILERAEMDGYYVKVVPSALLTGDADLPVCICRLICIATGGVAGIGAAYGTEDTDAYRAMLFCAAVDKVWFAGLLGLTITKESWQFLGLSLELIGDRGPGESNRLAPSDESVVQPDRGSTPSHTPQSKGTVESSHPRRMTTQGPPSYRQSSLCALELFRREVMQAIKDNECSDASSRHTPEMIADHVAANPNAIHTWLSDRGRSDAYTMSREDAIRRFLKPITFELNAQGLWFKSRRYDSDDLEASGVRTSVRKGHPIELPGFLLPMCVRTMWLDLGDRLVEVQGKLNLNDAEEQLYQSERELEQSERELKQIRAEHREHALAAESAVERAFREQTGKEWNAGQLKSGKPPSRKARRHGTTKSKPRTRRR